MDLREVMEAMANAKVRMNGDCTNLDYFNMTGILNMTEASENEFGWAPDDKFIKDIENSKLPSE